MKTDYNSNNMLENHFVHLHQEEWLTKQRVAGKCHAEIMQLLKQLVIDKSTISLLEMDKIVEEEILKRGCTPTFKGYRGFPNALITSVNKQIVHGIPTDYKLQEGDVITFDYGATFEGAIADAADTFIYGDPKSEEQVKIIEVSRQCLKNAIAALQIGKRTGVIGYAIYKTASKANFNVITSLGGHSLTWNKVHAGMFISNKSTPDEGIVCQPGLTLAIEPILVPHNSSTKTKVEEDGWTITTEAIGAHLEDTIFVHEDRIEVITDINNYKEV